MSDEKKIDPEASANGCLAAFAMVGIMAAQAIATVALKGVVLSWLWGWFLEPLGARALSIYHAMGIALVVSVVSLKRQPTLKDLEKAQQQGRAERLLEVGLQLGVLLSGLAIAVFMGWIAKELM
jgi:hypothetical protein